MDPPEGKILLIDTVSQNSLNVIEKPEICCIFKNSGSKAPVLLGSSPLIQSFRSIKFKSFKDI